MFRSRAARERIRHLPAIPYRCDGTPDCSSAPGCERTGKLSGNFSTFFPSIFRSCWCLSRFGLSFIGSLVGGYGASQHLNFSPTWLRDRLLEASVRSVLPVLPSQLSWFLFKPLQSRVFILFSLACAGLVAAVIILRRRWYGPSERKEQNGFLIALVVLFLFSLLPVINLRLTLYQTLGERFLYLPSVFSCLLMAYLAAILLRKTDAMAFDSDLRAGFLFGEALSDESIMERSRTTLAQHHG